MPRPKSYGSYPTVLRGRREIGEFMRVSVNAIPALIRAGAPIRQIDGIYLADKLGLRLWLQKREKAADE